MWCRAAHDGDHKRCPGEARQFGRGFLLTKRLASIEPDLYEKPAGLLAMDAGKPNEPPWRQFAMIRHANRRRQNIGQLLGIRSGGAEKLGEN